MRIYHIRFYFIVVIYLKNHRKYFILSPNTYDSHLQMWYKYKNIF